MKKIPILIDCDTGTDDAVALIMACAAQNLQLLGVTTVAGNQTVDKTTLNTLKILSFLGRKDVPVARGAERPLLRTLQVAAEVHGSSGLGGVILPDPDMQAQQMNAVELIRSVLIKNDVPVTLVCTAPLTNIALLLSAYPQLKHKIERIVMMGGGLSHGNVTAAAEFNIYADPEAAGIVMNSGVSVVMCPLDMTEQALLKFDEIEHFASEKGKVSRLALDIFRFYAQYYEARGFSGVALHDPTTIAYLMRPELFTLRPMYVQVETAPGAATYGMTFADTRIMADPPAPNAQVCIDVQRDAFIRLLTECCRAYDTGTLV